MLMYVKVVHFVLSRYVMTVNCYATYDCNMNIEETSFIDHDVNPSNPLGLLLLSSCTPSISVVCSLYKFIGFKTI